MAAPANDIIIRFEGVSKSFGDRAVLRDVSCRIRRDKITVIVGPSGVGKSVFIKILIGLLRPDEGQVWVDEVEVTGLKQAGLFALRKRFGMMFQDGALFDSMSVGENVAFPLRMHTQKSQADITRIVAEKLRAVGLPGIENMPTAALSGGMRKRVGFARAIVMEPEIVLFDEPNSGLDPVMADAIDSLILNMQRELGITFLVISHDIPSTQRIATTWACFTTHGFGLSAKRKRSLPAPIPFWRSSSPAAPKVRSASSDSFPKESIMNEFTPEDRLCVNTLRGLAIDAIERAKSGHPGLPLGAMPMAYALFQRVLKVDPKVPSWPDRDRFVLSAGHGSALLYAIMHLYGYDLSLDELKAFRQWGSKTPGHPEFGHTPGVEATTGPLGQGAANAVGMAMAERHLAARFNRPGFPLVDHATYVLVGDGDLMEGVSAEAASLAGHLRLGKLIMLYDANAISLDGPTDLTFTEDVGARYRAYGWQVLDVADGDDDLAGIEAALLAAKAETSKPSLLIVRTTIGYGSPNKQGTCSCHGSPLGEKEVALTKQALGLDPAQSFAVAPAAYARAAEMAARGATARLAWDALFAAYGERYPELAAAFTQTLAGHLPADWDAELPVFGPEVKLATRESSGLVQNAIARRVPFLLGGDADLSCSTKTAINGGGDFNGQSGEGRNIRFGVREHAMGAIANGLAYHGGVKPFIGTFFMFSGYLLPTLRLAAMNRLPVVYLFTHDSIQVGEDGPTHQPIEQLANLRAIPGLTVLRPADAGEVVEAWRVAMATAGPVALILSRQGLPTLDRQHYPAAAELSKGAYILSEAQGNARAVLLATGAEVHLALTAQALLAEDGVAVRVVSLPSWELFAAQPAAYRQALLLVETVPKVAVEAAAGFGWERFTGFGGALFTVDRYGASAPASELLKRFGYTAEALAARVKGLLPS